MPRSFTVATALGALSFETRGQGPAVLGWPSLFCDRRTLQPLVDHLARDHRVVLLDGPGHGRSAGPDRPFTVEACADAAMQVLDAAGVDRAVWVGAAWGGQVGALAAIRHPARVQALVTINTPMNSWTGRQRLLYRTTWWLLRLGRSRALARKIAAAQIAPARLAARPDLLDPIVDCIVQSPRRAFLAAVRSAMIDRPSLLPLLPSLRTPTLFVTGAEDRLFPVALARAQAAAIAGARFEVIPGTAHQSLWEDPEAVVSKLREFLASLAARLRSAAGA